MSVRNIIVQLRNNSSSTITLGTLSIAPATSATIWDTKTFATGIENNFEQVISGITIFNQNIGNGNLIMVVENVDQSAANAWLQFRDLVHAYKEESIRDDFDVLRLLRLYATNTTSGLLSSNEYIKLSQLDGYNLSELFSITGEVSGFATISTSTISVNDSTREFSIAPVSDSFDIWINSYKITKSTTETVAFADVEGLHYFYYNKQAVLTHTTDPAEFGQAILSGVLVCALYWDSTNNVTILFGDERHGFTEGRVHYHFHQAFGAQWYDGGALGNITVEGTGDIAIDAQLSVSNVTLADEDIIHKSADTSQVLTFPAQIPIFYRSGADGYWRRKTPTAYPMIYNGTAGYSGTYVPYNEYTGGVWQLTSATSGNCVLVHFFAGNSTTEKVFGIQGQSQYTTIALARAGASTEIATLTGTAQLLSPEFVRLGTIIVQTASQYDNVPKARIRSTDTGDDYIDFRGASVRGTGVSNEDHGNLSGLLDDDHLQYLLVNGTRAMTSDLNMGNNYINNVDGIELNSFADGYYPAWQEGLVWYDSSNHTLVAYNDQPDVIHQIGQETFCRVVNKTGSTILNGSVVYINGAQGNRPTIALAKADSINTALAIGLATHDILDNQEGLVTVKGFVHGVNTSTFTTGDYLYVSPSIAGGLTNIKPLGEDLVWMVGIALNSTNNGSIAVGIQGPTTLTELHDVNGITSALDGYYLRGNGTTWEGRVFNDDVLSSLTDGYIQNLGTITFNNWPIISPIDGYIIAEFGSHQNITINLDNQSSVTIQLNEAIGPGNFVLILKQGSSIASTINWLTEGTHALYAINGTISIASGTSSITLIYLNYDGTDWYATSSQPMQQVIAN